MSTTVKGKLSESEGNMIQACTKGDIEQVKMFLKEADVHIDCLDDTGMTPLQHAAFRGKQELCELLLANGADVNSNYHENGYTALMFAALSGNPSVTKLMLEAGGKKDHTNSVGRNAAQMAAFVGQHPCVAVINNYFDKSDIEYFTIPRGQEKEPKLPPILVVPVTRLMNMSNMHPVKISMYLQDNSILLDESYKVCKVLDIICEKAMKAKDTQDIVAMKAHYFATVIRHAKKTYKAETKSLASWIKSLLKGREKDGYPEMQDRIIRQALKDFPYIESQLLQTIVQQLSTVKIGEHPTSLHILMQGVNGQKFGRDEEEDCSTCGEADAKRKCSVCKMAYYCDQVCQKAHWFTHKKYCKELAVEYLEMMKRKEEIKKEEEELEKQRQEKELAEQMKQAAVQEKSETSDESKQNGSTSCVPTEAPSVSKEGQVTPVENSSEGS